MTQSAVDLLIRSRPAWHQAEPSRIPVSVKQMYGVLGRRNSKWESILSMTDDMYIARRTMEAASAAGIFERVVITRGYSVNGAPTTNWETIECALPQHRVVTGDSFNTLLTRLQTQTANINPEGLYQNNPTPLLGSKQTHTWSLLIAVVLATLDLNAPALIFVAALSCIEILFLKDERPVGAIRMRSINTFRNWFYAFLNGALLVPLVLKAFE